MSLGYSRLWWNWELDRNLYYNWNQLREDLLEEGTQLLIYMNPMLTDVSMKANYTTNYFRIAKEQRYLVEDKQG